MPRPLLALAVTTAGGLGLLRPAPGTWGSLGAAVLAIPVLTLTPPGLWQWLFAAGAVLATVAGILACPAAIRHWQREDPSHVVIDEVAGQWLALACVPTVISVANPWGMLILGFLMFRVFDIIKPWPVSSLERLPAGWGIMADDLAAGVLAGLTISVLLR
jgi:phosphatidylglycerophosphatase A